MALLEKGWSALLVSLGESAPFVIFGLVLAGLIREFVPAGVLKNRLGGAGLVPVLRAVGLGALLPICSCSTIPLGLGMARSGAGTGTVLAFMTSAPALSPVTIVLGLSLLGPSVLGSYSVAVLLGSCCLGFLGNKVLQPWIASEEEKPAEKSCCCGGSHAVKPKSSRLVAALRWGLFDLGSEISLSLLIGLLLATALLVFVPDAWVLSLVGQPGPLAILAVIILAVPAYTCSVPALLIAASLLAKGADPGLAIAFLIAGPATNLGELNAIRSGLGTRTAGFYLVAVVLLAIVSACTIRLLPLPTSPHESSSLVEVQHEHRHLHFGDDALHPEDNGLSTPSVSLWRLPFVCIIVFLSCQQVLGNVLKRFHRPEKSLVVPEKQTNTTLLTIDGHANKGMG